VSRVIGPAEQKWNSQREPNDGMRELIDLPVNKDWLRIQIEV
jgi:hypothetical protein